MPIRHPITSALLVALALSTAGCSDEMREAATTAQKEIAAATAEGGTVDTALAEARRKLHEENLKLGGADGLPAAELTPAGDLLINGVAVPLTDAQRSAAVAYRSELLAVAEAGLAMGQEGAALAGKAISGAVAGMLSGEADAVAADIEAEARKIETAAQALCQQADGLRAAQEAFAAAVPEFQPYAKAIEVDVDCAPLAEAGEAPAADAATPDAAAPN